VLIEDLLEDSSYPMELVFVLYVDMKVLKMVMMLDEQNLHILVEFDQFSSSLLMIILVKDKNNQMLHRHLPMVQF
jgi:hypothetical protein